MNSWVSFLLSFPLSDPQPLSPGAWGDCHIASCWVSLLITISLSHSPPLFYSSLCVARLNFQKPYTLPLLSSWNCHCLSVPMLELLCLNAGGPTVSVVFCASWSSQWRRPLALYSRSLLHVHGKWVWWWGYAWISALFCTYINVLLVPISHRLCKGLSPFSWVPYLVISWVCCCFYVGYSSSSSLSQLKPFVWECVHLLHPSQGLFCLFVCLFWLSSVGIFFSTLHV